MWVGEASREQALGSLEELGGALWRRRLALGLWVAVCLALAALYLHTTKPAFIAAVQLVLEPRERADDGPEVVRLVHQLALDDDQAQTQLHVITSDRLLRSVFDALNLAAAPELSPDGDDRLTRMLRWLHGLRGAETGEAARARAFDRFTDRVRARRLALSYVIEIAYRAQDPRQASRVANAIASAYVRERIASAVADAQVGVPYLKSRIASIYAQELVAGAAVASGTVPDAHLADADVLLLGPAVVPFGQSYPKAMPVLALAAVLGLTSGLAGIALSRRGDTRLRTVRQAQRLGVAVLGAVPQLRRIARAAPMWSVGPGDRAFEQALRSIRAALYAQGGMRQPLSIGVLSWTPQAGTSTIGAGLVELLVASGEPARFLDVGGGTIEAMFLEGDGAVPAHPDVARLAAIMAQRPPDTTIILALPALRTCVGARAVLGQLDAVILVVDAHRSTTGDVQAALRLMADCSVAGVVMNQVPERATRRRPSQGSSQPLTPMTSP